MKTCSGISLLTTRLGLADRVRAPRKERARPRGPGRRAMVIRVLVASGVRAYRDGLQRVLQGAEGLALVGIASTAEQVVEEACKLLPSVILLEIDIARRLARANQFAGTPKIGGIVVLGTPELYEDV